MLALLFRGVFLVGVIGWYSASLWKAVDNYFKGQFQRYLDEEYQKNPRMRDDVRAYTTANNIASDLIVTETQQQQQPLACSSSSSSSSSDDDVSCPIDKTDLASLMRAEVKSYRRESVPVDFGAGAAAAEIEVVRPSAHTDQPAFRDSPVDEAVPPPAELYQKIAPSSPTVNRHDYRSNESPILGENNEQFAEKIIAPKEEQHQQKMKEEPKKEENQSSPRVKKKTIRLKRRPKIVAKTEVTTERAIEGRQKVPLLKLTKKDFEEAASFLEFDYEDGNQDFVDNFEDDNDDDFNGIPLKDLPFKPMIDVYDLERVSEEEYCPLSLDDDPTCDELRSWP